MITNFSASYAGHVVDDDLGFDGVAANDRRYPNEALAGVFDWALDIAQHLDRLGYDEFWMAEHHFQPEGYECIPNLLMLSLYLATKTERLKFGCGFNITPMWHPLRLAEDFAMADILTNGRVIFGVGRGYHSREVETFGSPMIDADANRELFEEQVEVILKAFTQESFSHQGKHFQIPARVPYRGYQLEKLSLVPRPTHQPVEVWQPLVSGSPRGIDFMAKMGIKPLIANNPEPVLGERIKMFQEASLAHGKELQLGEDVALGYRFFIADTQEKAMELAQPYFEEAMKFAAPLGLMRLTPEQIESVAQPGLRRGVALPTLQEAVDGGTWLCGPSEMLVEHLKGVEERYPGVERINLGAVMGMPREVFKDQLSKFAEEVMPAFSGKAR
ncbi:MAG: LLM class flavin-dependent oxidoreductase [Chloroflexi bacterium]|nr:LLM class flavin-dependent oxidoreductase [Chloroflexota bacterium]MCI0798629.1 LLM class flavin-dependent oxidoreductase [Chloroflexota bacterium]